MYCYEDRTSSDTLHCGRYALDTDERDISDDSGAVWEDPLPLLDRVHGSASHRTMEAWSAIEGQS